MASADAQILAAGTAAAPLSYTVPNAQELIPLAVNATVDGAGAAGAFVATLEIVSPAGVVVARVPTDTTIAAGSSAEVTWAPFLRSRGAGTPAAATVSWCVGQADLKADTTRAAFFTFETNDAATFEINAGHDQFNLLQAGVYRIAATCEWLSPGVIPATDTYTLNIIEANAQETIIAGHSTAQGFPLGAQTVWDVDEWDVWDLVVANRAVYLTGQTSGAGGANTGSAVLFVERLSAAVATPFPTAL